MVEMAADMDHMSWSRPHRLTRATIALVLACAIAWSGGAATGAISTTVVSVSVPSATNLTPGGCAAGTSGVTDMGVVLPGDKRVTTADCSIVFGSSNDTSMLRLYQGDGAGSAMARTPTGPLDSTFDTDGVLPVNAGPSSDLAYAVAHDSQGRILVAGETCCVPSSFTSLVRVSSAGLPDGAFGASGVVNDALCNCEFRSIAVEPDDDVLTVAQSTPGTDLAVFRHRASDGALDTTFDNDGHAEIDISGVDKGHDLVLQPDGKIIAVGPSAASAQTGVVRLTSSGALDTTYVGGGKTVIDVVPGQLEYAEGAALDSSGRLVIAGLTFDGTRYDLFATRRAADGTLDGTFNGTGSIVVDVNGLMGNTNFTPVGLSIDSSGRILLAASSWTGTKYEVATVRLLAGGGVDASWGPGGIRTTAVGSGNAYGTEIRQQGDGKVVVGVTSTTDAQPAILRFNSDGTLDSSFNANGIRVITEVALSDDRAGVFDFGRDGRYVVVGTVASQFSIMRFDTTTVNQWADTSQDWDQGSGAFGACLRSVSGAGVVGTWAVDADNDCTPFDTDPWNPIVATSATAGAKVVASPTSTTQNATANLRFGFRASSTQPPGSYIAPVAIEVLAPNA